MFWLKKLLFKFMELGLGLKTYFSLETKDPIFINFKLSAEEARAVQKHLPPGFKLQKIRFTERDLSAEYWISYNLYYIKYPKKELAGIRRVRCEINTFVRDASGRKGVLVFCGSPLVSRESKPSPMERLCDWAEHLVIFIYGCGKLIPLVYELSDRELKVEFEGKENRFSLHHRLPGDSGNGDDRLSAEYAAYNDISFFNHGKTYDRVHVTSAFSSAKFHALEGGDLDHFSGHGPFFQRPPDKVLYHRGDIPYLVDALNRC